MLETLKQKQSQSVIMMIIIYFFEFARQELQHQINNNDKNDRTGDADNQILGIGRNHCQGEEKAMTATMMATCIAGLVFISKEKIMLGSSGKGGE